MRAREFDAACSAMRRGLISVVPERALRLFTWRELEVLVCGDSYVDVDFLMTKATYQGWDAEADGVTTFHSMQLARSTSMCVC